MISVFLSKLLTSRQASFTEENINIFDLFFAMQPIKSIVELQVDIEKKYNDEELVTNFGRKISDAMLDHFKTRFGMKGEQLKSIWINMLGLSGLGKLELVNMDKDSAMFQTNSSTIAKMYLNEFGKQKKPVCSIICGMLESYIKEITGKQAKCKETSCMAAGQKQCVFEISF
ncbi:MAG TPA: 4-vinyl reductase [archaeon]|nr:4-vinyl reductase [archaeon]